MEGDLNNLQAASRSSKKKQKKKNASNQKTGNKADDLNYEEMLSKLKKKLEEAKSQNDHKKASELRNQVWVLTDVAHGVRTQIPDEELTQILEDISKEIGPAAAAAQATAGQKKKEARENEGTVAGVQSNRMRNLQKKLDQIEALKERAKKGEKLEANQLEKIKSEDSVREEMENLTQILSNIEIKL